MPFGTIICSQSESVADVSCGKSLPDIQYVPGSLSKASHALAVCELAVVTIPAVVSFCKLMISAVPLLTIASDGMAEHGTPVDAQLAPRVTPKMPTAARPGIHTCSPVWNSLTAQKPVLVPPVDSASAAGSLLRPVLAHESGSHVAPSMASLSPHVRTRPLPSLPATAW